jgi:N-acetylneuraminic acid mutarotase
MRRVVTYGRCTLTLFFFASVTLLGCSDSARQVENEIPVPNPTSQPEPAMPGEAPQDAPPSKPSPISETEPRFPGNQLEWTQTVRSPVALSESGGLAVEERLYIFGGFYNESLHVTKKAYAFDPAQKRWYNLAPMPEALTHAGQAFYGGKIYLAGGYLGDHPGPATADVWIYDIAQDSWTAGPALPEAVGGGVLVELSGQLHFFGGALRKGSDYVRDSSRHLVLDVAAGNSSWTEAAPLPTPRNHLGGAAVGGKVYAVGGQFLGDQTGNVQTVEVYDPRTDSWQEVAPVPTPVGHISAATFGYGGRVIVVMGVTVGRRSLSDIIAYDPKADMWESLTRMPGGRSAAVSGVIGGNIVLATGTVGGRPLDTTWVGVWK